MAVDSRLQEFYDVLKLNTSNGRVPTQNEIKKAYYKLALTEHPDRGGDAEVFKLIANAYQILSDDDARREYLGGLQAQSASAGSGFAARHDANPFDNFNHFFNRSRFNPNYRSRPFWSDSGASQSPPPPAYEDTLRNRLERDVQLGRVTEAQKNRILQSDCVQALREEVYSYSFLVAFSAEKLEHVMHPVCIDVVKSGVFWAFELSTLNTETLALLTLPHVAEALKNRALTLFDLEYTNKEKKPFLTNPICIAGLESGVFSAFDIRCTDVDNLPYILKPQVIDALKKKLLRYSTLQYKSVAELERMLAPERLAQLQTEPVWRFTRCGAHEEEADTFSYRATHAQGTGEEIEFTAYVLHPEYVISAFRRKQLESFHVFFAELRYEKNKLCDDARTDEAYQEAADVASKLVEALEAAEEDFLAAPANLRDAEAHFVSTCRAAVLEARPVLEVHLGWAQVLTDILNVLVSIATLGIPNMICGRWRLFKAETESEHEMNVLEEKLDAFGAAYVAAPAA